MKLTGKYFGKVLRQANRGPKRTHVVVEYPEVAVTLQPRFRGRLQMIKDEQGEIKCVCCLACEKICPTQVITIEKGKKEGRKTPFPLQYDFEMERCIFCEFCVESCGFDSIILNHQFELAGYDREDFSHGMEGQFQNMFSITPVGHYSVASED
ncbi:MAG: 4Fe-4S dicluster domain-containing protein [Holophagaceae bacterium]|nr:4Fe-4S dicluster domain-containing protein [Holophagaceae bacterium]